MVNFSITILGAGSATPTLNRHPTSQLLTYGHESYLIDCGEGTQYRLLELKLRPSRLKAIFISHLHGDHYFGLAPLLSSLNLSGRTEPLDVFAPEGLEEILNLQLRIAETPLHFKLNIFVTNTTEHYLLFENAHFTVHTIPLVHRIPCAGFLFREKPSKRNIKKEFLVESNIHRPTDYDHIKRLKDGEDVYDSCGNLLFKVEDFTLPPHPPRSYAFCSDTRYEPSISTIIKDVELVYHEATFAENDADKAADRFHATAKEAAKTALDANAKKLLIGHFSSRYKTFEVFLEQAKSVFSNTEIAEEGQIFEI